MNQVDMIMRLGLKDPPPGFESTRLYVAYGNTKPFAFNLRGHGWSYRPVEQCWTCDTIKSKSDPAYVFVKSLPRVKMIVLYQPKRNVREVTPP